MAVEKRPGFKPVQVELPDEVHRMLRWGKYKSGQSITSPLRMEAERKAEEIARKYGNPPADFE